MTDKSSREAVKSVLAGLGITEEISEAFEAWAALPAEVRAGSDMVMAGRGTIFVEAPSAAAMHKIFYNKPAIAEAMNRRIGSRYVKEIKIEIVRNRKGKSG